MKKGGEGGVRAAVEKKKLCGFFFILGSYLHSFSGAFTSSLFSPSTPSQLRRGKKIKPPNSVHDRWTSQYTQTDSYLPLEETLVFSQS